MSRRIVQVLILVSLLWMAPLYALAENEQLMEVKADAVTDNLYFIYDTAGMSNVAALTGPDGVFIVDSKASFLSELFMAALAHR